MISGASSRRGLALLAGILLAFFTAPASRASILGVSAQVGTPGAGATVWFPVAGSFADIRLGFNTFSFNHTINSGGNPYALHVQLRSVPLLVDWYPLGFGFHLTGGVVYNGNRADYTAEPQNGEYVIDGTSYPAATLGTVSGTVTYPHLAPYLGFGFGDPFSGVLPVFFSADFGAFYQKNPNVTLISSNPSANQLYANQFAAEAGRIHSDLGKYRWYPVVSFGIGIGF
ncbi:MAG: hypothetical protein M1574_05600 [Gammaproteobacteria bacterium]|jgi:hypothetical protein|nr:hypothetical protein [Gammaproteobacteria bacterium]